MEEQKKDFTGVWIPKHILEDTDLDAFDKILYAEINSFDECFKSNETLAKDVGCSVVTITRRIAKLKGKKYIELVRTDGRKRWLKALSDKSPRLGRLIPQMRQPNLTDDIEYILKNNINTLETNVSSTPLKAKKVKSKSEFDYKEILNDWSKQTNEYKVFEHYLNYRKIVLHSQIEVDRFKKTYYKSASIIKKYSPQRAERVFLALVEKKNQDWSLWNVANEISNKKYE